MKTPCHSFVTLYPHLHHKQLLIHLHLPNVWNLLFSLKCYAPGEGQEKNLFIILYFPSGTILTSLLHYCLVSLNISVYKIIKAPEEWSNGSMSWFPQVVKTEIWVPLMGNEVIFLLLYISSWLISPSQFYFNSLQDQTWKIRKKYKKAHHAKSILL